MIIHFFTKGFKTAGSSRQRAFLVAEELNKRGVNAIVYPPPLILGSKTPWPKKIKLIFKYLKIFTQIKKEDIIYLQRTIYNKYFFVLVVLYKFIFKRKIIFDFDDALYLHSSPGSSIRRRSYFKTKTLTQIANAVVVGSHALYEWAKKYNQKVYLIPTSLRFENYQKFTKDYSIPKVKITIGWIGGAVDQYDNLKLLVPIFEKLIVDDMPIKFLLIGALGSKKVYHLFQNIKGLEVEFIDALDWSDPTAVPSHIQKFDIGVMPLVDNEWNKGKCAFKAIEYMACGVATICSSVGENNYLIKDGVNGFLAKDKDEWYNKFKQLILDKNLREKLGKEGQKTIKEKYSYQSNIPKLMEIFKKL
jgi:glycosyltransferase involved in cell wall biosynthesis